MAAYDKALSIDADCAEAWCARGGTYYLRKHYHRALDAYNKALNLKPRLTEAWRGCGYALNGLRQYDKALAAFDKALGDRCRWYGNLDRARYRSSGASTIR